MTDLKALLKELRGEHVCGGYDCNWDDTMITAADVIERLEKALKDAEALIGQDHS